jgi:hypothetical protein
MASAVVQMSAGAAASCYQLVSLQQVRRGRHQAAAAAAAEKNKKWHHTSTVLV